MIRGHESSTQNKAEITVREGSALWTQVLRDAEAKQNEAFRKFHDWYYGLMDPNEERRYTDAVILTMEGLASEEKN